LLQDDLKYWVALSQNLKIGPRTFQKLHKIFPDFRQLWTGSFADFASKRLPEQLFILVDETRKKVNPEKEMDKLKKLAINTVTIKDKAYPEQLKEIADPPAVLYWRGNLADIQPSVSVVGTRKFTAYGQRATEYLVEPLAKAGLTICSGLALGIDSLAHQAALQASGRTIAVLGSGLDRIYPTNNRALADKILQKNGAIVSEYPLGTPPFRSNFPMRNRIVAGLSLGTLVIEAALQSGALITAACALDYNRQVFALPGSIYSDQSAGTNNLIKLGAKPVTQAEDILEEMNIVLDNRGKKDYVFASPQEEMIAKYLANPCDVDKLAKATKLDIATVNATLTLMEIAGSVRNLGSGRYVLR